MPAATQALKQACADDWLAKSLQSYWSELQEQTDVDGEVTIGKVDRTNGVNVGSGVHVGARVGWGSKVTVDAGISKGVLIDVAVERITGENSVFAETGVGVFKLSVDGVSNI